MHTQTKTVASAPAKRPRGFAQKVLGKLGAKARRANAEPAEDCTTEQEPVPAEAVDGHVYWWLTRTNRKATCATCRAPIDAGCFRVLFHPNESSVEDRRIWKHLFWRYHHVHRDCLPCLPGMPEPTEDK
jgi:hypothetical protein